MSNETPQPSPSTDAARQADPPPQQARFHAGDVVAGRYRIVSRLGQGGMGDVYRADDLSTCVCVALKFLPPTRASDPQWVEKLKKEVSLARQVTHKGVCRVHDFVEGGGLVFLTMEFIEGDNLGIELEKLGRASRDTVVAWAWQLCDSLAAIHEAGLVHCDLKPQNIIVDRKGLVRIVDLGLARQAALENSLGGTIAYMAPEQYDRGTVTPQSDLYSLGLVLYQLASGLHPYPHSHPGSSERAIPPRPPSEFMGGDGDRKLDKAILQCLEHAPQRRPETARQLQRRLPPVSPEVTQTLKDSGAVRPMWAFLLFGAVLVGLVLQGLLAKHVLLVHQARGKIAPEQLPFEAQNMLRERLGWPDREHHDCGLVWDVQLIRQLQERPDASRSRDIQDKRDPILYFWYRESPNELVPTIRHTPADPPLLFPGMRCVILDLDGRLVEFRAIPNPAAGAQDSRPDPKRGAVGAAAEKTRPMASWEKALFDCAKLNPAGFKETEELPTPPVFAGEYSAWTGKEDADRPELYVEMAAHRGQPVFFQIWRAEYRADELKNRQGRIVDPRHLDLPDQLHELAWILTAAGLLAAVALVPRNLKRRWIDFRGTFRVVLFFQLALLLGTAFHLFSPRGSLGSMRKMSVFALGTAAFWSGVLAIAYMAFEPYLRRRWPTRFTAWNRFLNGRLRDSLVGRDVLLGTLFGTMIALLRKLLPYIESWRGIPSWTLERPLGLPLDSPDVPMGWLGLALSSAIVNTVMCAILLLLLVWIMRREWLAVGVLAALGFWLHSHSNLAMSPDSKIMWIEAFVTPALVYAFLIRFGLLATVVCWFTALVALGMPLTFDYQSWYFGSSILGFAVLVILAAYGALIAMDYRLRLPELG
jgi:hypothetical protein